MLFKQTKIPNVEIDENDFVCVCGHKLDFFLDAYASSDTTELWEWRKISKDSYEEQFIQCYLDRGRKI